MAIEKVNQDFYEVTGHRLSNVSFLKLFNILRDTDGEYFLNIFRSFTLNESILLDIMNYITYIVQEEEFSENISYKLYDNINLWWIVFLANQMVNPFEDLEEGSNIKILKSSFLPYLIREMKDIADK